MLKYGEAQYTLLAENVERLSSSEHEQVKYHTECYKSVVHKRVLERAEQRFRDSSSRELLQVAPAKIGRPSKLNDVSGDVGLILSASRVHFNAKTPPKASCTLYKLITWAKGLLTLKKGQVTTESEQACHCYRSQVMLLHESRDAAAYELRYHRDCIQKVERQCEFVRLHCTSVKDDVGTCISNTDIISAVKCSLSTGTVLNMNDVNDECVSMLCENGVNPGVSHFKDHLKH